MILCNLAVLMAERKLKISKLSLDTGISRTTLTALYYNTGKGIQFDTANVLCMYLGVDMKDLFTTLPFDLFIEGCQLFGGVFDKTHKISFSCKLHYKNRIECPVIDGILEPGGAEVFGQLVRISMMQDKNTHDENAMLTNVFRKIPLDGKKIIESRLTEAILKANEDSIHGHLLDNEILCFHYAFPEFFTCSDDDFSGIPELG